METPSPRLNSPLEMLLKGSYLNQQGKAECAAAVDAAYPPPRKPSRPLVPLGQIPDPLPEEMNPAALFKRGWLRKGGGAFMVALAGVGKSVWTIQAAICWALGKTAFGVEPVRPLKIAVIQAEDDRNEVAEFRNAVRHGLVTEFGFDEADINFVLGTEDPATARVFLHKAVGLWGEAFVNEMGAILDERPDIDLVIVNPFQAYFGGDCSKNAELSQFFRSWLDREIKDPDDEGRDRAAVLFIHHTNKPPNDKDLRENWGNDLFAAYIGAGGAEIVNWARAILSLMPTAVPGLFRFIAGKRGQRLGWVDATGKPVYSRLLKHAGNGGIYWREGTAEDAAAVAQADESKGRRGAVGGDGNGGRPPDQTVYDPLFAVKAVFVSPGLTENSYRKGIADRYGCSSGTALNLLNKAVSEKWLVVKMEGNSKRYGVTDAGKEAIGELQF